MNPDSALLDDLSGRVSGRVLRPTDDGYDAARRVHNGLVDRAPAVIVRCRSAADAAAAVRFARAAGLDICVRGGGHNVAGRAVVDGAVMIDLAEMKGTSVDADAAHGAGGGRAQLGGAQRRHGRARSRRHRRRDLHHGHRRADARRRARLADGEARPRRRQPSRRRARQRRRRRARRDRGRPTPTSSGRSAAAAATSASPRPSRTACIRWRWSPAG